MSKYIVYENGQQLADIDLDGNEVPIQFESLTEVFEEIVLDTDMPAVVWYNGKKIYAHEGIYGKSLYEYTPDDELTQIVIKRVNDDCTF